MSDVTDFTVSVSKVENGYIVVVEDAALGISGGLKEYVAHNLQDLAHILEGEVPGVMLERVGRDAGTCSDQHSYKTPSGVYVDE